MKRRSKASGKLPKAHRRKALSKRGKASVSHRRSPASDLKTEIVRLRRELQEALAQQTSTSEVLKVISRSTFDLKPVLESLLEKAIRLCDADRGLIYRQDGDVYRAAASYGHTAEFIKNVVERNPIRQDRSSATGRAALERRVVHIHDILADPEYRWAQDHRGEEGMHRTILAVPMLREDTIIGVIAIRRLRVQPFTDRQVELVQNFAAQAVIAIENARLLNELRQSLERQTATADVLRVISSSPGELAPVFQSLLGHATRLCVADFGFMFQYDGNAFQLMAQLGGDREYVEYMQRAPFRPGPETLLGSVVRARGPVQIEDFSKSKGYLERDPLVVLAVERGGVRTLFGVPMLKDNELVGAIAIYRREVRPFTDKQIALLQNFAAQAVIAIENARLLNELRQSLERQTATADVLRVISSSPGDLEPVFQAMLENATRLCEASYGNLLLWEGDGTYRMAAVHGDLPSILLEKWRPGNSFQPNPYVPIARVAQTRNFVQVEDLREDQAYLSGDPLPVLAVDIAGARTLIAVPMLKEDRLVGAIVIYRREVRPFTDKQIALVTNFAAQAVIAIENARLLNELRQSLEQQTATADVLRVISSSPGELETVFQAMLANATRICQAELGMLWRAEGNGFRAVSLHGIPPDLAGTRRDQAFHFDPKTPLGRLAQTKRLIHVADARSETAYIEGLQPFKEFVDKFGARTLLLVPMLKDDVLVGAIAIYRKEVRPFVDKQIELVQNFAAQAVIAIENTRLLNELRQRTTDLTESLEQQTATADVLRVISSSPTDIQPVLEAIVRTAGKLCDAEYAMLYRLRDGKYHPACWNNAVSEWVKYLLDHPLSVGRGSLVGRTVLERRAVHILDCLADPEYTLHEAARIGNQRTMLGVPLLHDGVPIGVIGLLRTSVKAFTEKQIELVTTFADQAVIAIENTRLLSELRQSLQQQTATADVLKIISRSTFDLKTVLDTLVESAARLCDADMASVPRVAGGIFDYFASYGYSADFHEFLQNNPTSPGRGTVSGRAVLEGRTVHIPDVLADPEYDYGEGQKVGGYRTLLGVPLLREGAAIGALVLGRSAPRPFTPQQIELVETFADQAVIAMENTRLLNELRESLQQQTATADVLKVISRSTFDLKTVLDTLLRSAARLCEADQGTITQRKGDRFYRAVAFGYPQEFMDYVRDIPVELKRDTGTGRALLESKVIQIPDIEVDPEYTWSEARRLGGFRAMLGVPMLREGEPIGVLTLTRKEPRSFTEKQIELVTTFADQAAIAIENVRLFDEIQDKSRQLEEASQHKSQFLANMSHELRTPLNAILGYTELMADGAYGDPSEKMSAVLKRLESNGRHLLGLINDVLDLSKIEAGQLVLELSDYSVQDIAKTVRSTLEPLAADKKLAFKVEVTPELPPGRGDGRRLTQVLINLVGNAIKFTDAGEVAIKATANNGSFHVSVRDTGPGISATDQAKLFQEFQQADNAVTKKKGGTGLGLAISKRIIEMHGGRIWVESQPGHGSTFAFTLPVSVERQIAAATGAQ
jgi:GAF domain-containing protein